MGRDLIILDVSDDLAAASQLDGIATKTLGTREQVLSIIKAVFPDTDISDPKWVIVTRPGYSLRFSMSEQDPVDALLVTVHGEEIAEDDVKRLSNATGWRVFDSSRGEFLDMKLDSASKLPMLISAHALRRDGQYGAALALYLKAAGARADPDLYAMVATCYYAIALGNPNETGANHELAVSWMQRAVGLAPDRPELHASLAEYYELGLNEYARAAAEYRIAIKLEPHQARVLHAAAVLYHYPEQVVTLEEAIGWLEHAVEVEPDEPYHSYWLGEMYMEADRPEDARKAWRRALLCPEHLIGDEPSNIEQALTI